nr:glycosyl hydrolase family 8 [Roseomonas sp. TAS13]
MASKITRRKTIWAIGSFGVSRRAEAASPHRLSSGDFASGWHAFARHFLTAEGRVVDTGNGGITHSEGQGWAMLFALQAGDRTRFERIADWTRENLRRTSDGLHAWRGKGSDGSEDLNNATDGDLFIATALILAGEQWGRPEWRAGGLATAQGILRMLPRRVGGRLVLLPGLQGFERSGEVVVNPSYYAFPMMRVLARALPDPLWLDLATDGLALLRDSCFGPYGLPADWVAVSRADGGVTLAEGWPARFSYDAVRVPLWLGWAGLVDEPGLRGPASFWADAPRPPPAWVDLRNAEAAPVPALPGMAAVAGLAMRRAGMAPAASRPEGASRSPLRESIPPAPIPAPLWDDTYYSAALSLLVALADRPA